MNFIILDLEATCWDNDRSKQNEIIEIGAVKINSKKEIVEEFQAFIKPVINTELSDFCKSLTHIKQSDVDSSKSFKEVLEDFEEFIGNEEYLLCSWGFYDKSQFEKDCNLHKLNTDWLKNHISLKHQHQSLNKLQKGMGLGGAIRKEGFVFEGTAHRGIDDAKNIAKIFIKYFDKWKK